MLAAGPLLAHTRPGEEAVVSLRHHYDGDESISAPESMRQFQASRLSTTEDEAGTVHYGYDARGRVVDIIRRWSDGPEHHHWQDYDAASRIVRRGFPDRSMVDFNYDSRSLLRGVTGLLEEARYTAWGALEGARYGNGVVDGREYDARQRPTRMIATNAAGTHLRDLSYEFDVTIGNRALKLDRDSSVPVMGPGASAGVVSSPGTPIAPLAWALGIFLVLVGDGAKRPKAC